MSGKKISPTKSIVISALKHIGSLEAYRKCWMSDHFLFRVMMFQVPAVVNLGVDLSKMNLLVGRQLGSEIDDYGGNNICGVFRYRGYINCPYEGIMRRVTYYYFMESGGVPDNGMPMTAEFPALANDKHLLKNILGSTRSAKKVRRESTENERQLLDDIVEIENDIVNQNKRARYSYSSSDLVSTYSNTSTTSLPVVHIDISSCTEKMLDYWQSPECHKLFGVGDEDVRSVLEHRIDLLKSVSSTTYGYKKVIDVVCESKNNYESSDNDIWILQQKSMMLCLAYHYALKHMNHYSWVNKCCQMACDTLCIIGVNYASNPQTIANWNKEFRKKEVFHHPIPYSSIAAALSLYFVPFLDLLTCCNWVGESCRPNPNSRDWNAEIIIPDPVVFGRRARSPFGPTHCQLFMQYWLNITSSCPKIISGFMSVG